MSDEKQSEKPAPTPASDSGSEQHDGGQEGPHILPVAPDNEKRIIKVIDPEEWKKSPI